MKSDEHTATTSCPIWPNHSNKLERATHLIDILGPTTHVSEG